MEHEALQSYKECTANHVADLLGVENYWVCQVKLITLLNESVVMDIFSVQVDDSLDTKNESSLDKDPFDGRVVST